MKTMAAVINWNALELEAARVPPDLVTLLDNDDAALAAAHELPGCAQAGRTST